MITRMPIDGGGVMLGYYDSFGLDFKYEFRHAVSSLNFDDHQEVDDIIVKTLQCDQQRRQ